MNYLKNNFSKGNFKKIAISKFSKKNFDMISFGNVNYSKFSKGKILLIFVIVIFLISLVSAVFEIKTDIKEQRIGDNKKYIFEDGQSLEVIYSDGGKSVIFNFQNLKSTSDGQKAALFFEKNGKVIEANFKTSVEGTYVLGNEKISLPAGSEVRFKDGIAKILIPKGEVQFKPNINTMNKNSGETIFEFKTPANKFLFNNNNYFEGNVLKYKDGNYYFDYKGRVKLNDIEAINDYEGLKNYIDFKGEVNGNYDGAYISMNKEKGVFVTGSNVDTRGPKVTFLKNNPYGIKYENEYDHFALQSLGNQKGAYVKIQNRDNDGKVPKIDTLNQFVINFDDRSIHYHSGEEKLYYLKSAHITDFGVGKSSVPIEIQSFKNKNGKVEPISKYGNVLGIGTYVEFGYGSNPYFIKTTTPYEGYDSLKRGFSNSWFYYNIKTVNDMKRFLGGRVNIIDNNGVLNNPGSVKWVTDLLAGLPSPMFNSLRTIEFTDSIGAMGAMGLAWPGGHIQIASWGFGPTTIRHEIHHNYDFANPYDGRFTSEWMSVGYTPSGGWVDGATKGFAWGYGSTSWLEDVATFGDIIYNPSKFTNLVSNQNPYSPIYRGKLAVLRKYEFISQGEYELALRTANLDYGTTSIEKYINEAKQFKSRS
ncbi:MAG: hypothetical protein ABIH37_03680 [archaeon]